MKQVHKYRPAATVETAYVDYIIDADDVITAQWLHDHGLSALGETSASVFGSGVMGYDVDMLDSWDKLDLAQTDPLEPGEYRVWAWRD